MGSPLLITTLVVNYSGLVAAIWLGWFVLTRSPRRLISWLTSLMLWSVAGLFLNIILALIPPSTPPAIPEWLRILLPFWPVDAMEGGPNVWLQGWSVSLAIALWHHVTVLMRPGNLNISRWFRIVTGYLIAAAAIWVQANTPLFLVSALGDPLYVNTLKAGALYPLFALCLLLYTAMSIMNLSGSAHSAGVEISRTQFRTLLIATLFAGFAAPISVLSSAMGIPIPMVLVSGLLSISVVLMGFGVANYSALMEGRTIRRDFYFNALSIFLIIVVYSLISILIVSIYQVNFSIIVFVIILVITTHSLIDAGRGRFDRMIFQRERGQIRSDLRDFGTPRSEDEFAASLNRALQSFCESVRATYGMIFLMEANRIRQIAEFDWPHGRTQVYPDGLSQDDVSHVSPGQFGPPFEEAALLIPLYKGSDQLATILLGRPVNGANFAQADVELLLHPSDLLAEFIFSSRLIADSDPIGRTVRETERKSAAPSFDVVEVALVEDALKNLYDFAHLGDSPISRLKLVQPYLSKDSVTHVDKGKAVYQLIVHALEKLRPVQDEPCDPIPREWHAYLVLHDAYVEDRLNRDIMSKLYISEGTFNRTRRSAIRTLARMLGEMESSIH